MNPLFIPRNQRYPYLDGRALIGLLALWCWFGLGAFAQSAAPTVSANAPFSTRATHVLGWENTKSNSDGTLSIQGNELQFQEDGKPGAEVAITSVRHIVLDEENKQVGGMPMTLGKAAAPFGTGRMVSLVAHKNYDILTLEYVDSDGGIHSAIFQLTQGQGDLVRNELVVRGVSSNSGEDQRPKQSTAEVTHENE